MFVSDAPLSMRDCAIETLAVVLGANVMLIKLKMDGDRGDETIVETEHGFGL